MKQYNQSIKGKLFKYFEQRLNTKESTKGWYRCDCIYCGGKYTFGINLSQSKAHCFKCDETPEPIAILMTLEGFETKQEAYAFLKIQEEFEAYSESNFIKYERKDVKLPESFTLLNNTTMLSKIAFNYMIKGRKFNQTQLTLNGVGFCNSGEYAGYIIFPFYERGELVFFQGRRYTSVGPKMKNPKEEDFGIGKSYLLYNADALYIYRKINLVESVTNALTLGNNTVAALGKTLSAYQVDKLIQSPCEYINIILDSDALWEAINLAMILSPYKKVKITEMPEGKDVNDLGKKATLSLSKKAEWGDYNYFFRMKLEYEHTPTINSHY